MHMVLYMNTAQDMQAVEDMPGALAAASTKPSSGCCCLYGPMPAHQYLGPVQAL